MNNGPTHDRSPQGRRVLVAVVTGEIGARIQRWREQHDPFQAARLPPHTTLCYWVQEVPLAALEQQVRHAFREPVTVRLGSVREFDEEARAFYVEVLDTTPLDAARAALHDGTFCRLPPLREWTWHVTCVRDSRGHDLLTLRAAAAELVVDSAWHVDTVALMELRGDRYEPLATWTLAESGRTAGV